MANGWTEVRRKRQAAIIRTWNPSSQSTGPRTTDGKARSSLNTLKHGGRSKSSSETLVLLKELFIVQIAIRVQVLKIQ